MSEHEAGQQDPPGSNAINEQHLFGLQQLSEVMREARELVSSQQHNHPLSSFVEKLENLTGGPARMQEASAKLTTAVGFSAAVAGAVQASNLQSMMGRIPSAWRPLCSKLMQLNSSLELHSMVSINCLEGKANIELDGGKLVFKEENEKEMFQSELLTLTKGFKSIFEWMLYAFPMTDAGESFNSDLRILAANKISLTEDMLEQSGIDSLSKAQQSLLKKTYDSLPGAKEVKNAPKKGLKPAGQAGQQPRGTPRFAPYEGKPQNKIKGKGQRQPWHICRACNQKGHWQGDPECSMTQTKTPTWQPPGWYPQPQAPF
jgi:hypothetical protein